jgi:hypothetical protein
VEPQFCSSSGKTLSFSNSWLLMSPGLEATISLFLFFVTTCQKLI